MIARKKTTKKRPVEKTVTRKPLPKSESPAATPPTARMATPPAPPKPLTIDIAIESIDAQPFNPRTTFDQAELQSLAASLRDHGLLQPIIVRTAAAGKYDLIAGGRRLKAAKLAGWKSVPATVRNATDEDAMTWAMIENVDRADLNPIDLARGVAKLCAPKANGGCGLPEADAAAAMGRGVHWVRRQIRLLKLPEIWLARIASGEISPGAGEVLVKYEHRPAVLAKIEQDMLVSPWAWRTVEDFERSAATIADEGEAASRPAVAPLQPMRARPGESEDPDTIRRRKYPKLTAAASTRVADEVAAADPPTPPPTMPAAHAGDGVEIHGAGDVEGLGDVTTNRVDVAKIVELIDLVDDATDLNKVTLAVDRRRRELTEAAAAG